MAEYIGTGFIAIFSLLVGFLLNIFYESYKEKMKTRKESLNIHFDDIKSTIISDLRQIATKLIIYNNRLAFEVVVDGYTGEEPFRELYKYEDDESYLSFEVHFPERAREWKQLNSEATAMKGYIDIVAKGPSKNTASEYEAARKRINDDFFPLQQKFRDFAQRLARDVETIGKYQIGTVFKYTKKCPICKKF